MALPIGRRPINMGDRIRTYNQFHVEVSHFNASYYYQRNTGISVKGLFNSALPSELPLHKWWRGLELNQRHEI